MAIEMTKDEARVWLREGVEWIRKGLQLTSTTVDDQVCDMLISAIDSDILYGWIWSLLDGVLDNGIVPKGAPPEVVTEADAVGVINPLLVISIIKALWDLYHLFRGD